MKTQVKTAITNNLSGLYLLTPNITSESQVETLLLSVQQAILGGACVLQFRNKSDNVEFKTVLAKKLQTLCHAANIFFLINDSISLAKKITADGVHLGQNDDSVENARTELGPDAIVGVSCYNELSRAKISQQQGADYVAFGRFFPSNTKPETVTAPIELLTQARSQLEIPLVAIGGINAENAQRVKNAGADMVAVIDGVFEQSDVKLAAQKINNYFL